MELRLDIPEDLVEWLDKWAPKAGKDSGHDLAIQVLEDYRMKKMRPYRNAGGTYAEPRKK